ncbi:hypothetical protein FIBSPDRAFT_869813 [Athelia psychrophila]|uniref:Uncharacterized protein n=1 Tax=Athelia psychrophila TaxID=1759441 RepID=A0A166BNS5_9AGAM|nr:hypothetical protein FIBSPDRAFT_869813 [Fibularhizoctonia sp. CBS 109695]
MDKCNFGMRDNCRAWWVVRNGLPAGEQEMAVGEEVSLRGELRGGTLSNSDPQREVLRRGQD